MRAVVIAWLAMILAGCAASKGFDRGTLRDSLGQVTTDKDIQEVLALKPQLPAPFKLGVFLNSNRSNYKTRVWTDEEKNDLLTYGNRLKEAGVVSVIYLISEDTIPGHYGSGYVSTSNRDALKDLRLEAARYGADALLVITDVSSVDRYNNPAALLYLTIVGAYLVPGTQSDALVMMRSSLWDVRNGYLYATQDAEGIGKRIGPAFVTEDTDSVYAAKKMAIADLGRKLTDRLIQLNAQMP
ncbi:conserved exported protein of unknown function [Nitrospira japonica]|uniref:Lipoprotein n=1 Tax=Nitrospira japonica TaxID=1325564 RepID=A0A1W1I6W3_9BACT|nr:hypothetical protein [Nitrospira japonica]SLM48740.1 conserved exported protein of unknown function [Nitrospira japonica]